MNHWTYPEIERLRKCWPVMSRAELEKEFPRHPISAICVRASKLKLTKPRRDWKAICQQHVPVIFGRGLQT